jgi:retinol dehydrogenase-12
MSEDRYNTSKLLVIMLALELAIQQRQKQQQVVINALNPGFCRSDLFRHAPFPLNILIWLGLWILGRSAEMGSRTLVHAASAGPEMHGKYLDSCKPWDPSPYVLSEEGKQMRKKLYAELKEILEGIEPGVTAQSA